MATSKRGQLYGSIFLQKNQSLRFFFVGKSRKGDTDQNYLLLRVLINIKKVKKKHVKS